jgi:hypothetical protein
VQDAGELPSALVHLRSAFPVVVLLPLPRDTKDTPFLRVDRRNQTKTEITVRPVGEGAPALSTCAVQVLCCCGGLEFGKTRALSRLRCRLPPRGTEQGKNGRRDFLGEKRKKREWKSLCRAEGQMPCGHGTGRLPRRFASALCVRVRAALTLTLTSRGPCFDRGLKYQRKPFGFCDFPKIRSDTVSLDDWFSVR